MTCLAWPNGVFAVSSRGLSDDLPRVASTPYARVSAVPGLVAVYFWEQTDLREVEAFAAGVEIAAKDVPIGVVFSVHPESRPPDKPTRDALVALWSSLSGRSASFAGVLEGRGLGVSSRRTLMRAILSMARIGAPWQVFGSITEAAKWTVEILEDAGRTPPRHGAIVRALDPTIPATSGSRHDATQ